jgi:predicted LPLAT superfamily acyltransferase
MSVPFFLAFRKRERRASFDFFSRVYGTHSWWRLLWHTSCQFWCWGACWADRSLIFGRGLHRYHFDHRDRKNLNEAINPGKGLILLTAHVGNYAIGGWMLKKGRGKPVTIALIDDEEKKVRRFLEHIQGEARPRIINISSSFYSSISILKVLREGEIVGIQGDRAVDKNALPVNFFGSRILLPAGPFLLSLLSGTPISISFTLKEGWKRYVFFAGRPIFPPEGEIADREEIIMGLAQKVAIRMEDVLRKYPHQWFNFYPYWVDSPGFKSAFRNASGL